MMDFTSTTHGSRKIIDGGYMYVFQKNLANGVELWECEQRRWNKCKAKVKLQNDQIIARVDHHTHAPNQSKIEVTKLRASMKTGWNDAWSSSEDIIRMFSPSICRGCRQHAPHGKCSANNTVSGILPILATGLTFQYSQMSFKRPTMMNAFSSMTVELVTLTASSYLLLISALACWSSLATGLLTGRFR